MSFGSNVNVLLVALVFSTSCTAVGDSSSRLMKDFREAAKNERLISFNSLETRRKFGDAAFGVDLQSGGIELNKWGGTIIKDINQEYHGSPVPVRLILLKELRENGCLFFLRELNRYYLVLSEKEFLTAAKVSGKEPSALYTYSAPWGWSQPKTH